MLYLPFISFVYRTARLWRGNLSPPAGSCGWVQDPLSHPDLASMSQVELADLPFPRYELPEKEHLGEHQTRTAPRSQSQPLARTPLGDAPGRRRSRECHVTISD